MNAAFEKALAFTGKWEGDFTNDPRDRGGATRHGVSLRFLKGAPGEEGDIDGDGEITLKDVLGLTRDEAAELFKRHFWTPLSLDQVPEALAMVVFDAAVNMGVSASAVMLQQSLNALFPDEPALATDGVAGPRTLARLEKALAAPDGEERLIRETLSRRAAMYLSLGRKEQYAWAVGGWMNRTRDLWDKTAGTPCPF